MFRDLNLFLFQKVNPWSSRLRGRQIQSFPTLRCEYAIGIEIHMHAMNVY